MVACLGSGLIEFVGSFFAVPAENHAAGSTAFHAGGHRPWLHLHVVFLSYLRPAVVGISTLGIILLTYFGKVRFKGGMPGGLVAVGLGTALAWLTGVAPANDVKVLRAATLFADPSDRRLRARLSNGCLKYLSIIIPMGLFNLIGSLQNIESAEAAGDRFAVRRRW